MINGTLAESQKTVKVLHHPQDESLVEAITNDVLRQPKHKKGLFVVRTANQCIEEAKSREIPNQLFKEFWFENELCILFADSNVGKSILAVQIANEISQQQPVLYFDFELNDKQFENRYSENYSNHYIFPANFFRAEIDPDDDFEGFASFEDYLIFSLEQTVKESTFKILIIDNITYLKNETDKAKNALPLMIHLKKLKEKYGLSILVLAHTPKRDLSKPLTQNDLGGSKMIMNFCDSAFAIGASQKDSSIRYLKQIKERNTQKVYGPDNIYICQITKPSNYLFMEFISFGHEHEHLKIISEKEREEMKLKAKELASKGWGQRSISKELGIALGTVNKYINN